MVDMIWGNGSLKPREIGNCNCSLLVYLKIISQTAFSVSNRYKQKRRDRLSVSKNH